MGTSISNDLYATRWQHHDIDKPHFYLSPSKAQKADLDVMYQSLRSGQSLGASHRRSNTNFDVRALEKGDRISKRQEVKNAILKEHLKSQERTKQLKREQATVADLKKQFAKHQEALYA